MNITGIAASKVKSVLEISIRPVSEIRDITEQIEGASLLVPNSEVDKVTESANRGLRVAEETMNLTIRAA